MTCDEERCLPPTDVDFALTLTSVSNAQERQYEEPSAEESPENLEVEKTPDGSPFGNVEGLGEALDNESKAILEPVRWSASLTTCTE